MNDASEMKNWVLRALHLIIEKVLLSILFPSLRRSVSCLAVCTGWARISRKTFVLSVEVGAQVECVSRIVITALKAFNLSK